MQCTSDACVIIFTIIFPIFGVILGTLVFLSPLPAVMNALKQNRLGVLNPIPYAIMFGNCIAWFMYALVIKNYYILAGNGPGILLSCFYMICAYSVGRLELRDLTLQLNDQSSSQIFDEDAVMERRKGEKQLRMLKRSLNASLALTLGLLFILEIIAMLIFVTLFPQPSSGATGDQYPTFTQRNLIGITCVVILVMFYSSPLTTLVIVIRQRDSSSFDWRLSLTCTVNGAFWAVYGLVIGDGFIWGPNLLGSVLGIVQLICICAFPARLRLPSTTDVQLSSPQPAPSVSV